MLCRYNAGGCHYSVFGLPAVQVRQQLLQRFVAPNSLQCSLCCGQWQSPRAWAYYWGFCNDVCSTTCREAASLAEIATVNQLSDCR
jgi:hypothetical protein